MKANHADADSAVKITEIFTKQARRRMSRNVRGLTRNEDAQIDSLAGVILQKGNYPWDVI